MIAYLQGKVLSSTSDKFIILTDNGVGYEIHSVQPLIIGERVELFISTIFKEAGTELFAFLDFNQKLVFEFVLQVNGVGPKSAFSIVKNLGVFKVVSSILSEDELALKSIPGIGTKTAKQIILDLKSKIEKDPTFGGTLSLTEISNDRGSFSMGKTGVTSMPMIIAQEIKSALRELGFKDQEIQKKFNQYNYSEDMKIDDVIKEMIKN